MTRSLSPTTLAERCSGTVRVVEIAPEDAVALAEVGVRPGLDVTIERRLPFGGPVLLELGTARIAVARAVAARTIVAATGDNAAG
jgi:Fe2+ transport system protein FeoA